MKKRIMAEYAPRIGSTTSTTIAERHSAVKSNFAFYADGKIRKIVVVEGCQEDEIMNIASQVRSIARWTLAGAMVGIGALHLVAPEPFVRIVPRFLPEPLALVYVSGVCEVLGGIGLLVPPARKAAGWGLIALYAAVFPANVNMAVNNVAIGGAHYPLLLWLRLPLQAVFVAWAWWCSQPEAPHPHSGQKTGLL